MLIKSLESAIGSTPLLEAQRLRKELSLEGRILLKLEMFNPGGSIKDRAARAMLDAAGLKEGDVIVEPTSGNTGVGLAWLAAARGMRAIFVMPENMSDERKQILRALGADVVLTPAAEKMAGAIRKANEILNTIELPEGRKAVSMNQFSNPANPEAHELTTGPEIWADAEGRVDILVAGVGTGGTLTGTARALKRLNPELRVVAVEPAGSPVLAGGVAGPHKIQGIGGGFVPDNYDPALVDEIVEITDAEAYEAQRLLVRTEGVFAGISAGAATAAAIMEARKHPGASIVAILPDTGERYLSVISN